MRGRVPDGGPLSVFCVVSSVGQSNCLLSNRSVVRLHYNAPHLFSRLASAGLFCICATPGAYQPQSLSGVSLRSGQCDFLCGQIAPGRWLTHPKERHDVWNLQKENPQSGSGIANAISATIIGQLDTNFKIGRRAALREIEDVKHDTREAEDVLDVAVAIAEADGEIEPEERKVLEEIAGVLGLRLENHL